MAKAPEKAPASAVATQERGGALAAVPEWAKGKAGVGTEKLTNQDIETPRIKLIQGTNPELEVYDGLKAGMFFHTLAEQSLGAGPIPIVPLFLSKRYVLWRPRKPIDMGGILARADDAVHWEPADVEFNVKVDKQGHMVKWKTAKTVAESGLDKWGTFDPRDPNSQPAATECHVIVVATPSFPELPPAALFLQRSAIKPARKLLGRLKITQAPIYATKFNMESFDDEGPSGPFKNWRFTADGFVQDPEQGRLYEEMYESFKKLGVKVKIEDEDNDAPAADGASGAAANEKKF